MRAMRISKVWPLVVVAAGIAIPAAAQKPDLSGTWKLNLSKSFLAGDHPAKDYEMTKIIAQKGSLIKQTDVAIHVSLVNIPMPDSKATMELVADAQEHEVIGAGPVPGMPPVKLKTVAEWQGGTLLVTESGRTFAGPSTTRRRYFLSDDGLQLIELVEVHSTFLDTEQRLVFDKQP